MYVVIMAGGGGTRLWPLSSPERPKPFLPLFPDGTLFEKTVRRLLGPELGLSASDITVVAAGRYASLAREQWPGIGVLVEPEGRNTTAAVALATIAIDRPDDDVMVVLPADHLIGREDVFRGVIRDASLGIAREAFGLDAPLVTLGVQADRAATEYGYLIPRHELGDDDPRSAGLPARAVRGEARGRPSRGAAAPARGRLERGHVPVAASGDPGGAGRIGAGHRRMRSSAG